MKNEIDRRTFVAQGAAAGLGLSAWSALPLARAARAQSGQISATSIPARWRRLSQAWPNHDRRARGATNRPAHYQRSRNDAREE
jgi:hypothetical protein